LQLYASRPADNNAEQHLRRLNVCHHTLNCNATLYNATLLPTQRLAPMLWIVARHLHVLNGVRTAADRQADKRIKD
jgi:hypothetical protein